MTARNMIVYTLASVFCPQARLEDGVPCKPCLDDGGVQLAAIEPLLFDVGDDIKGLRETLCIAQTRIAGTGEDRSRRGKDLSRIQKLIDECDRHRPLGSNGKHGDRHTESCGCEDNPLDMSEQIVFEWNLNPKRRKG